MSTKIRKDEYGLLTNGNEGYKHGVIGIGSERGWWTMGLMEALGGILRGYVYELHTREMEK